jgi:ASC-1-like (ASCH) protein
MSVTLGKPTIRHLTLKKIYIEQIRAGQKTVEGRIFERSVKKIRVGDHVRFYYYSNSKDDVTCQVVKISRYTTFRLMLEDKGYEKCIPKASSLEAAAKQYAAIPNYTEKEKKFGVVALELMRV